MFLALISETAKHWTGKGRSEQDQAKAFPIDLA